ncbi:MAG: RNA polymerase sigma-70 factor [Marinifilaceae bacterium]
MGREHSIFFEKLFKQYYKPLYYYTLTMVDNNEVAEDIVMDAFNYIYKRLSELDVRNSLSGLLYKICRTKAVDYIRHQKRHVPFPDTPITYDPQEGEFFTERYNKREILIKRIKDVMDAMPEQRKRVFEKCFIAGKSYKVVAEELDISVNTVKSHVMAALKTMREQFSRDDLFLFFMWTSHRL